MPKIPFTSHNTFQCSSHLLVDCFDDTSHIHSSFFFTKLFSLTRHLLAFNATNGLAASDDGIQIQAQDVHQNGNFVIAGHGGTDHTAKSLELGIYNGATIVFAFL